MNCARLVPPSKPIITGSAYNYMIPIQSIVSDRHQSLDSILIMGEAPL